MRCAKLKHLFFIVKKNQKDKIYIAVKNIDGTKYKIIDNDEIVYREDLKSVQTYLKYGQSAAMQIVRTKYRNEEISFSAADNAIIKLNNEDNAAEYVFDLDNENYIKIMYKDIKDMQEELDLKNTREF